jgi:hypothetical protein
MRRWINLGIMMFCMLAGRAAFADGDDPRCRRIKAEIDLTHGTIEGNFGLNGTVVFVRDSSGTPPSTGPVGSSVFSGLLTITTTRGNLILRETGMFSSRTGNAAGPLLYSIGEAVSGTDRFVGTTGDVFFNGRRVGDILLVDVVGTLCRP